MSSQTKYVVTETLISAAINTAFSIGFVYLVFHGQSRISATSLVTDMAPQTLAIVLMACLVPALLTRRRLAAGNLSWSSAHRSLKASRIFGAAAIVALLITCLVVALCWLILPRLIQSPMSFHTVLIAKATYGLILASIVTPCAITRILA